MLLALLSAGEWIGVAAIGVPLVFGFIAWLTRLGNRTTALESDMSDLKNDVKEVRSEQRGFRDTLNRLGTTIEVGFARIEEQIKTLFRDQEKH